MNRGQGMHELINQRYSVIRARIGSNLKTTSWIHVHGRMSA